MADPTCGPSNAFKGLTRHVDQDRSVQKDRVSAGYQQPTQNFRSSPSNSGLTGQYGAFHQQLAELPQHPTAGLEPHSLPFPHASHPVQAPNVFERLSSQRRVGQQPAGLSSNAGGSWVGDFQRMNLTGAQAAPFHNQNQTPHMNEPRLAHNPYLGFPPYQVPYQPPQPHQPGPAGMHGLTNGFGVNNEFIDARAQEDLEREFDQAMDEWMAQNGPQAETSYQVNFATLENNNVAATLDAASAETSLKETTAEIPVGNTDTELARAAQQLVDSVSDNETDKFKNSKFLEFMRRLAAHELTVRDNELVETPQALGEIHPADDSNADASPSRQDQLDSPGQVGEKQTHA